jgi:YD repeat-containing protein
MLWQQISLFSRGDRLWRALVKYVSDASIRSVHTTYNLNGQISKKRFDGFEGPGITNYYDGISRLAATTDINGRSLWYGYNQASARTVMLYPEGISQTAQYYQYDAANKLTSTNNADWSVYTALAYDSLGRQITKWSPNSPRPTLVMMA